MTKLINLEWKTKWSPAFEPFTIRSMAFNLNHMFRVRSRALMKESHYVFSSRGDVFPVVLEDYYILFLVTVEAFSIRDIGSLFTWTVFGERRRTDEHTLENIGIIMRMGKLRRLVPFGIKRSILILDSYWQCLFWYRAMVHRASDIRHCALHINAWHFLCTWTRTARRLLFRSSWMKKLVS